MASARGRSTTSIRPTIRGTQRSRPENSTDFVGRLCQTLIVSPGVSQKRPIVLWQVRARSHAVIPVRVSYFLPDSFPAAHSRKLHRKSRELLDCRLLGRQLLKKACRVSASNYHCRQALFLLASVHPNYLPPLVTYSRC